MSLVLQVQILRFPVTPSYFTGFPLQDGKGFSILFLSWSHKNQTPDSENSSKQEFCYFHKMCAEYAPVNNLQKFSRGRVWHKQHFWKLRQFLLRNLYCLCQQKWWVFFHTCLWTACSSSRGVNWVFQLTRLVLRRQNQLNLLEVPKTITELFFLET